jgi:hypothetical protein
MRKREKKKPAGRVPPKERKTISRGSSDEKYVIEIHTAMVGRIAVSSL